MPIPATDLDLGNIGPPDMVGIAGFGFRARTFSFGLVSMVFSNQAMMLFHQSIDLY